MHRWYLLYTQNLIYILLGIFITVILKMIDDTVIKTDSIFKGFIVENTVLHILSSDFKLY